MRKRHADVFSSADGEPELALAWIYWRDLVATGRDVDTPAWRFHLGSAGEVADVSRTLELSADESMKEHEAHPSVPHHSHLSPP